MKGNRAKQLNFEHSQNSRKLDLNVGLDTRICVVNLLSVIITITLYKGQTKLL